MPKTRKFTDNNNTYARAGTHVRVFYQQTINILSFFHLRQRSRNRAAPESTFICDTSVHDLCDFVIGVENCRTPMTHIIYNSLIYRH